MRVDSTIPNLGYLNLSKNISPSTSINPFLKWPGGKRWLIKKRADLFPSEITGRYIEPFVGSGAVFFHLRPQFSLLSDINRDLIDTFRGIKLCHVEIYNLLKIHDKKHTPEYYYQIRSSVPETLSEKAARFIYLNRTCFNGIYRVNNNGQFNVPIGSNKNVLRNTDNFEQWSESLRMTELQSCDFESIIDQAEKGDFLFVDPPYTVRHNNNGFVKYNEVLFSWEDQERLALSLHRARKRKVKILMTNANHDSIKSLYKNYFKQEAVSRSSTISAHNSGRNKYEELIIKS